MVSCKSYDHTNSCTIQVTFKLVRTITRDNNTINHSAGNEAVIIRKSTKSLRSEFKTRGTSYLTKLKRDSVGQTLKCGIAIDQDNQYADN